MKKWKNGYEMDSNHGSMLGKYFLFDVWNIRANSFWNPAALQLANVGSMPWKTQLFLSIKCSISEITVIYFTAFALKIY
jgi:hypothetical protein